EGDSIMTEFAVVAGAGIMGLGVLASQALTAVKVDDIAPTFTLKDAAGTSEFALESYRHKRIVFVNFFATWCENCQEEMATLKELYAKYKDSGLVIVSISVQERQEKVQRFIAKFQLPFPVLLDPNTAVAKQYGLAGFPYNMIIDGDGIVRFAGPRPPADFEKLFNEIQSTLPSTGKAHDK
ncbi:MAG: TlpA disulfide reductase family protein, partial [Elusimicrobiota bacterium]